MVFSYPEFHGQAGEDVLMFLKGLEVACISNHIVDEAQVLCLLQICLKDDARSWFKQFEKAHVEQETAGDLTFENACKALLQEYQQVEDADKIWHAIQVLKQGEHESVEDFLKKFNKKWDSLCQALKLEVPPAMMKKDRWIVSLKGTLQWRVELKKPMTFEEAVAIAKGREWKEQRMTQLGVSIQDVAPPMRRLEANVMPVPVSTTPPIVQAVPVAAPTAPIARVNDDIRQDLNQVVDMMKTLSINLMNQGVGQRGHGRGYNSYNQGEDHQSGGGGYGRGRIPIPTCCNCGELGHKNPDCPKPRRMGGDMYPLPLHIPNRAYDYGIDLRDEAGPSRLSAEQKEKTKIINIVTVEKKQREVDVMPLEK